MSEMSKIMWQKDRELNIFQLFKPNNHYVNQPTALQISLFSLHCIGMQVQWKKHFPKNSAKVQRLNELLVHHRKLSFYGGA